MTTPHRIIIPDVTFPMVITMTGSTAGKRRRHNPSQTERSQKHKHQQRQTHHTTTTCNYKQSQQ